MPKRRVIQTRKQESDGSFYTPPPKTRRQVKTKPPATASPVSKYATRHTRAGLRSSAPPNMKEPETEFFESSQEESHSPVNWVPSDQPTPTFSAVNRPRSPLPISKAYLARCVAAKTPTMMRAALRNLKSAACGSSANIIPEIPSPDSAPVDKEIPSPSHIQVDKEIPSANFIQAHKQKEVSPEPEPPVISVQRHEEKVAPSPACSFNCTEIVAMMGEDYLDGEEVASKAYESLVTISGYRVKQEVADLTRAIISKYGDIHKTCICKSVELRSLHIEIICRIYNELKATDILTVTAAEIKNWLSQIEDLEAMNINVKWLRERLDELSEMLDLGKAYTALTDARNTVCTKISKYKKEVTELEAENLKLNEALSTTRAKIRYLYGRSFVGLV